VLCIPLIGIELQFFVFLYWFQSCSWIELVKLWSKVECYYFLILYALHIDQSWVYKSQIDFFSYGKILNVFFSVTSMGLSWDYLERRKKNVKHVTKLLRFMKNMRNIKKFILQLNHVQNVQDWCNGNDSKLLFSGI